MGSGVVAKDFPGGHPAQYCSRPLALSFGVLMGSGVVAKRAGITNGYDTRTSREVTQPSTALAHWRLASEF
ncbi:hypothetical protein CLOM_g2815 [Closterium sp. NIES-68]|nr:hypothetical protein CLOM_g2814 [Closterium sp. NIES-68]GJP30484.1 hypothetical protein CLOM_g2815 [Closterium sp. NIES-68]